MARLVPPLVQRTMGEPCASNGWRWPRRRYGSSAVLKSPLDHAMFKIADETRRTYRHHGRQRDAPRRIATFHHATLRVAPHRYATREPLGTPGGSRAFSADGHPQAPVAPRRSCAAKYMRADEFAASRRAVIKYRYRLTARALINQKVTPQKGCYCSVDFISCRGDVFRSGPHAWSR
jgi:hypothetical protein